MYVLTRYRYLLAHSNQISDRLQVENKYKHSANVNLSSYGLNSYTIKKKLQ